MKSISLGRHRRLREWCVLLAFAAPPGLLAAPPGATPPPAAKPAGTVLAAFPSSPDPALRYVVYQHGRIVEDQGRHAVHPERGAYDFDGIVQALARPGIAVIGELREKNADTCTPIFEQSPALAGHDEVRLSTGLGHGYLYRPLKEWIEPTIAWIQARKR